MKEKAAEKLYDSLTDVDDQFIQEASELPEDNKTKQPAWIKWGALAACLALTLILTLFPQPAQKPMDAASDPVTNPHMVESTIRQEEPTIQNDPPVSVSLSSIFVNQLSETQPDAARRYYDPDLYVDAIWDHEDVLGYYGKDLAPAYIPEGLLPAPGNGTAHVYMQKSDGKVVEDEAWLGFYHAYYDDGNPKLTDDVPASKGFSIRASKLDLLDCCIYILPENEVKTSHIGGTSVTIGYRSMPYGPYDAQTHEPSGYYDLYVAEFQLEGIQYKIVAEQMELDELVKVVSSMIYGEKEILISK